MASGDRMLAVIICVIVLAAMGLGYRLEATGHSGAAFLGLAGSAVGALAPSVLKRAGVKPDSAEEVPGA